MSDRADPTRRPTIADVAARAGTSTAVVSYVINGGPRPVSDATRARVETAVAALGYRRNALAGALRPGRTDVVGLVVPDSSNAFFSELARQIEGEARRRGLLTLLGNTGYQQAAEREYVATFSDLRPRGILLATLSELPAEQVDCPLVYLHSAPVGAGAAVTVDDERAAADAVTHLLDDGRAGGWSSVHCVTGPDDFGPAGLRERGWRRVMLEHGIDPEPLRHRAGFDRIEAVPAMAALLRAPSRPRAVFATTDEQALAVLDAAQTLGLRVPEDVAVVGFDGIRASLHGIRRLTTVAVPLHTLATAALDSLDDAAPVTRTVHATLVVGDTCGPHPG